MHRTIFLDRDGVINRKPPKGGYVTRWEDLEVLPGVPQAIALLNRAGIGVVVVSNQRCVARNLLSLADLEEIHRRLRIKLAEAGAQIDGIYYCPHENDEGCACRKPAPGMLLAAAREQGIDLPGSWMIGDSDIDIQAGKSAGCRTIQLLPDGQKSDEADLAASSLLEAVEKILRPGT